MGAKWHLEDVVVLGADRGHNLLGHGQRVREVIIWQLVHFHGMVCETVCQCAIDALPLIPTPRI